MLMKMGRHEARFRTNISVTKVQIKKYYVEVHETNAVQQSVCHTLLKAITEISVNLLNAG